MGIAGAGASAAALLAHAAGARVSGCDPGAPSPYTEALTARSIPVFRAHDPAHVTMDGGTPESDHDAATRGEPVARLGVTKALTAIRPDHPELVAARRAGVPVEPWQQVVADAAASQGGRLVAVAGTHGKSTSSGWLVHMLASAGRDPAAFVGALMPASLTGGPPSTARWGRGDAFVVEADEYAGNFDAYRPDLAIVLNAEWDHPDVFADHAAVIDTFEAWLRGPGAEARRLVIHIGDRGGRELALRLADWGVRVTPVIPAQDDTSPTGQLFATPVRYRSDAGRLRLEGLPRSAPDQTSSLEAAVALPGEHNAANAACIATLAALLGLDAEEIVPGLETFAGVARRAELKGEPNGVLVVDDYAHHPTAIRATIRAMRARYPGRRLWAAHEPLTYHRTAAMTDELAAALAEADRVVIADIWAGRDPDTTITSATKVAEAVARRMPGDVAAPGSVEATADYLAARVEPGDVVLVMGGGRSYVISDRLVALLGAGPAE